MAGDGRTRIKEKLIGSFLEDAPCCKVSSVTGEGIDDLTQTIFQVLDKAEHRRTDLAARMPIDRVFTIQGFGTVVTGTLNSGSFQKGQDVAIEPGGRLAKIRSIQVHGDSVTKVLAGQRAAINLSGLAVDDVEKGSNLVEPHHFQTGQIVDIELYNLAGEKRAIKQRQRIHFHLGTAEVVGRIHLLNQEELLPGKTCYAQVILESPVLAVRGDRFVIRYYSPSLPSAVGRY
jgi:selenocysteine-specific elongation factor